jgi:hypothetical protein
MIASSAVPGPSMLTMSYASISRRLAQVTDEIKTVGLVRSRDMPKGIEVIEAWRYLLSIPAAGS